MRHIWSTSPRNKRLRRNELIGRKMKPPLGALYGLHWGNKRVPCSCHQSQRDGQQGDIYYGDSQIRDFTIKRARRSPIHSLRGAIQVCIGREPHDSSSYAGISTSGSDTRCTTLGAKTRKDPMLSTSHKGLRISTSATPISLPLPRLAPLPPGAGEGLPTDESSFASARASLSGADGEA